MIEIKKLKQLILLMKENELTEIDLRDADEQVTLKRGKDQVVHVEPAMVPAPVAAPSATGATEQAAPANEGLLEITSPMVGTFYTASSPDSPPFARVGDNIDGESVVCIIEAMKVFNEIKAEVAGTIEKILVSNGQAVEFGEPLFLVRPS